MSHPILPIFQNLILFLRLSPPRRASRLSARRRSPRGPRRRRRRGPPQSSRRCSPMQRRADRRSRRRLKRSASTWRSAQRGSSRRAHSHQPGTAKEMGSRISNFSGMARSVSPVSPSSERRPPLHCSHRPCALRARAEARRSARAGARPPLSSRALRLSLSRASRICSARRATRAFSALSNLKRADRNRVGVMDPSRCRRRSGALARRHQGRRHRT